MRISIYKIALFCTLVPLNIRAQINKEVYKAIDSLIQFPTQKTFIQFEHKIYKLSPKASSTNDFLSLAIAHCNIAYYQKKAGLSETAITHYEQTLALARKYNLKKYDFIENAEFPLTRLYLEQGNYTKAENLIKQTLFTAREKNNTSAIVKATLLLSSSLHSSGNYTTAVDILHKIKSDTKTLPQLNAQRLNNMAINYIALKQYKDAELVLKEIPSSEADYNYYKNFALLYLKKERFQTASIYFNKAKQILKKQNPSPRKIFQTDIEEAQLWLAQNQQQRALSILNYSAKNYFSKEITDITSKDIFPDPILIDLFNTFSSANPINILEYNTLSIAIYDKLLQQYQSPSTQIAHQSARKKIFENSIEYLFERNLKHTDSSLIKEALSIIEKSKNNQLTEKVLKKNLLNQFPNDKALILESNLIQKQLSEINRLNSQNFLTKNLLKQIRRTEQQLTEVRKELHLKYPSFYQKEIDIDSLINKVQSQNSNAISFFYGKKYIYYITIGSQLSFQRIELTQQFKSLLSTFIHRFDNASIINNNILQYTKLAHQLFASFNFTTTKNRLLIIPDGILNFVPFEALLTKKTNSTSFSSMPFWVKENSIVYSNSLQQFSIQKELTQSKRNELLGIFPVFENTPNYLKHSKTEAKSISNYLKSDFIFNNEATKKSFISKSNQYDILHLCTHAKGGTFKNEAFIKFYDEDLKLSELYTLTLNTNLVVLSACETGIGNIIKGQTPNSIANGFQSIGAKNVVYSLWEVNDLSTSQWMSFFYKMYDTSKSISASNRQAKLDYLDATEISNLRKSPYYWSAFVYYGSFQNKITKDSKNSILLSILLLLSVMSIFIFFKYRYKKTT